MTIIYDYKEDKMHFKIYSKGAPDVLFEKCSHYLDKDGLPQLITPLFRK